MAEGRFAAGHLWTTILVGSLVRHPAYCESGARDDVLRGIPTMPSRAYSPFHFRWTSYTSDPCFVCAILNTGQTKGPNGKTTKEVRKNLAQKCRKTSSKREEGRGYIPAQIRIGVLRVVSHRALPKIALGRSLSKRDKSNQPSQPAYRWLRTCREHFAIRDRHGRPASWRPRPLGSDARGCR